MDYYYTGLFSYELAFHVINKNKMRCSNAIMVKTLILINLQAI
jgi:hypothetical protein